MSIPMEYNSMYRDSQTMDNLEKQLICPVCLEMFTKPVVILPCQHNLCRKCANDIFQSRGTALGSGGCFRCPSCHQEIILDRHGVYGLQRNLLVENIIDVYKQESLRSTAKPEQPTCEEHNDEKINIYCITCEIPTCSLCKVFGVHKPCEVAPLLTVYKQQKCKLGDGIGTLVATNDSIQAFITHLEETNTYIEENCRSQKQTLHEEFDSLFATLETKKQELIQTITNEEDEKISHCKSLIKAYNEHIQSMTKLVKSALQSMEEPQMPVFLQNAKMLIAKVSEATTASVFEELEQGFENMDHYNIDLEKEQNLLQTINFLNVEEKSEFGVEVAAAVEEEREIDTSHSELSATEISEESAKWPAREGSPSSSSQPHPEHSDVVNEVPEKENLNDEQCGVVDDLLDNEELGAEMEVPEKVDSTVENHNIIEVLRKEEPDESPDKEELSAESETREKQTSAKSSVTGADALEKKESSIQPSNCLVSVCEGHPNTEPSIAVDEVLVKDGLNAQSEEHLSAESLVLTLEKKECSLELSGSMTNLLDPNADSSTTVGEGPVKKELNDKSDATGSKTPDEKPSADSSVVGSEAREGKEASVESSGPMVNDPENDLIIEFSTAVNRVSVKETLGTESLPTEANSPERKVESSGPVVNVPEVSPKIESISTVDDISEKEELSSDFTGAKISIPESETIAVTSSAVNEVPAEAEPGADSADAVNYEPAKEEVNDGSEVAIVEVPLKEDSSAASPLVYNETPKSGAVFSDVVDAFPEAAESNEKLCCVIDSDFKIEDCNVSTSDAKVATRKEYVLTCPGSPEQISEIEQLMDKPSGVKSPEPMNQEFNAASPGTANVTVSVVESVTAPCRIPLETMAASPEPISGSFPAGEFKIPFIDNETGKLPQDKADCGLSEKIASQNELSGNCHANDLNTPQLLAVVEDDTRLYPGWHKCGSWHALKPTMLITSPQTSAASLDLSGPSQPEASLVTVDAGSEIGLKTLGCENTVSSPITKALNFCLSLMALMIILLNLWNRIEFMACTWMV
ncbi:uncharacterized protein [Narcine bancroftii]|uniref:uncharacterized protein isoform X2 n=1 Tax=Narcine bancroftii TaxID=1343680 RepID=UPI003831CA10